MSVNSFENYPMTWKPELRRGDDPLYISLANQLEADILSGFLQPGIKLPPQRELADYLDVNISTVSRAFKICSRKGLLSGTVGSGTFVAYHVKTQIFKASYEKRKGFIELSPMEPESISQDEIRDLLSQMITEPEFGRLFQYTHQIPLWHREAAVRLLVQAGVMTEPEKILFASGGQNTIAAIMAGLFQPGDRIGVDPLIYPGVISAAKLFGIQLIPIRQCDNELSEAGIRYAVKNEGIKALYIMPDGQNPTTHTMSMTCRRMIAAVAAELDLLVIEDGIHCLFSLIPEVTVYSLIPERTIFILSLSKTINPGLRLAYLTAPEIYFDQLEEALYNFNFSQSTFLVEIMSRLIMSGQVETLLQRRRKNMKVRNQLTDSVLKGYDVRGDQLCIGRWLILPDSITGIAFEQLALTQGVFVYGAERFAVGKDLPMKAIRLAICSPETPEELEQGLLTIRKILDGL